MVKNYLTIALRHLWKYKQITLINVFGLAVGMAACILMLLFVQNELSYDRFHENADRIYRVSREWQNQDGETSLHLGHVAPPFAPLLENDFPGVVLQAVRMLSANPLITYEAGNKQIVEENFFFADPDFFEVFTFPMMAGNPKTALNEHNAVVLTESTAKRYFGDGDPIGKTLNIDNEVDMKVTGVVKDVPANSHFHFDMLGSFLIVENFFGRDNLMSNWGNNNYSTFLLLPEGYDPDALQAQLPGFIDKHMQPYQGIPASKGNFLHLWPLTDIHLHSHLDSEIEANGDIAYVYIYTIIALFILGIACINFMNLSTARAGRRAKEVGVRKVMGAVRKMLIKQFVAESMLVAVFSLLLALVLTTLLLPYFSDFVGKTLTLAIGDNLFVLLLLVGIVLLVGLVAGSYPAFFLSAFQPAQILRGSGQPKGRHTRLRAGLVVLQFTIAIALIVGVITIGSQLKYVKSKPLGFNKDNLVVLPASEDIYTQFESIKAQLLEQPGISDVTLSSRVPSGRLLDSQDGKAEVNGGMEDINIRVADVHIDHDFLNTLQIELVAGRNFDFDRVSDSTEAFVINEAAVKAIGWPSDEEAVGKEFHYGGRQGYIIGVVKDFHFESLHQSIAPIVFMVTDGRANSVIVRVNEGAMEQTLDYLKERWSYLLPGYPFSYDTVGSRFDEQYTSEDKLSRVVQYFSLLAILIAALGLVGLASYLAEQRFKEIGIRKVMGASVGQILLLLTKSFTWLVLVAFVIACPIAYYLMHQWLDTFAYHDTLHWWTFLAAGVFALLIAWITVGSQTLRAATSNPVESLRSE